MKTEAEIKKRIRAYIKAAREEGEDYSDVYTDADIWMICVDVLKWVLE